MYFQIPFYYIIFCLLKKDVFTSFKHQKFLILSHNNLQVSFPHLDNIHNQFLTDIIGGNKVGITTILVNPIGLKDFFFTKINRIREKRIMDKLGKNLLFVKGRYYD